MGSLWLLNLLGGGLGPDRVSDAYYISSSSYVVQTSRDASGALRSRVDENSGVWTNIPGIRGQEAPEMAKERRRSAEDQLDGAMRQMNREMEDAFRPMRLDS